jgi:hypothetical protein
MFAVPAVHTSPEIEETESAGRLAKAALVACILNDNLAVPDGIADLLFPFLHAASDTIASNTAAKCWF